MKNYIKEARLKIRDFCSDTRHFGMPVAMGNFLVPMIIKEYSIKHQPILHYLEKNYADIIAKYKEKKQSDEALTDDCPIWICWLQGEEQMPSICKKCLESVKNHAGKHPVIVVTWDNMKEYVSIPPYILQKVGKDVSYTHFSDILRSNLLANKGGMWIDSTVYISQDFPQWNYPFYSLKQDFPGQKKYVTQFKWTTFFMGGVQNNLIHCMLRDCMHKYIYTEKKFIDYFLQDYFIALGYLYVPAIKRMIDAVPYSCRTVHQLQTLLYGEWKMDYTSILSDKDNYAFKLSYKNMPDTIDPLSVYSHLFG